MTPFEQQLLNQNAQILEQISQLRSDCEGRFRYLELHDRECHGNGQPGWKADHEGRISEIEARSSRESGASAVLAWIWRAAMTLGVATFEFFMHHK